MFGFFVAALSIRQIDCLHAFPLRDMSIRFYWRCFADDGMKAADLYCNL